MNIVARRGLIPLAIVIAACSGPRPSITTPVPTATTPVPTAVPGQIGIACDDPYPGHCLGWVAYGVANLPQGEVPVAALAATAMDYPCADTCSQPPHRGDTWVAFTLRDGRRLGMWVVDVFGMRTVGAVGPDMTPPARANPTSTSYPLICGTIPDVVCTGVAAGGVVANATPASIQVVPANVVGQYGVTFHYADGSKDDVTVAPVDSTGIAGWAVVSNTHVQP